MKAAQTHCGTTIFGGLLGALAGGFDRAGPGASQAVAPARPDPSSAVRAGASRPGFLGRLGEQLWRRQIRSVDLQIARSDDLFANLDRWLWKQHQRETEAWLAQSTDVHDLETRIRHLERNRDGRIF